MLRLLSIFTFLMCALELEAASYSLSFYVFNPGMEQIVIEGTPFLDIKEAKAGYDLEPASHGGTLFSFFTNKKGKKIWVSISPPLPRGVKLYLTIDTESGALTSGKGDGIARVEISSVPQPCIENIHKMRLNRAPMLYECETTVGADSFSWESYELTFDFN